jgi:class 3 adenylate cyclase/pimeloyl-ACP methyl ester carboxylesterase
MEPAIRYAQTADGVSIAFWALGEGMPFVQMPSLLFGHIQLEWRDPEQRRWYERLAEKRKVVRYDSRGSGLSEREVTDYSLDAHVLDLEAVVDRLGLERFVLVGAVSSGPAAIAYAARHPERVLHLILWCSYARGSDVYRSPRGQAFRALRGQDWEIHTETIAHILLGWSAGEEARRYAAFMRECVTQEAALSAFQAIDGFDASALLSQVRSPTLVVHRAQVPWPDVDIAMGLASRIPDARLVVLEGESVFPWRGDVDAVLRGIDEFLGEGEKAVTEPQHPTPGGLVTILFTDMEGSTTLTQRLGDVKAQEFVHAHNAIVRDALKTHGGSEIKHTGDGIMASFPSASRAIECAVAIQRAVAAHAEQHAETPFRLRIGLNAGEPVAEDEDLFGTAVQVAARICDRAEAGEILASDVVRQLVAGKGFLFADRGEMVLRGFDDPVRLYEVRWRED